MDFFGAGYKKIGSYRVSSQVIGCGSNGEVRAGVHIPTSMKVASKVINIGNPKMRERAYNEVKAMKTVSNNANVVKLYGTEEECNSSGNFLYLFLELAPGGDLFSYVQQRGNLTEDNARSFSRQIVSALNACHQNGIIHRDVKLENILITKDNKLRLSDFGLSVSLPRGIGAKVQASSCAGSPLYMAPEVFALQAHDEKVDIWSLGVCLFYMVVGSFPFVGDSYGNLEECVLFSELRFQKSMEVSEILQDLLVRMLHKDPVKRIPIQGVKQHAFFHGEQHSPERKHSPERINSSWMT